jgi:hypothetical protein
MPFMRYEKLKYETYPDKRECSKCREIKPNSCFGKRLRRGADGDYYAYRRHCFICGNEHHRESKNALRKEINKLEAETHKLKERLSKATEVIKFYGDEFSYDVDDYCGISGEMRFRCVLNRDMEERNDCYQYAGKKAREFLDKIKEVEL